MGGVDGCIRLCRQGGSRIRQADDKTRSEREESKRNKTNKRTDEQTSKRIGRTTTKQIIHNTHGEGGKRGGVGEVEWGGEKGSGWGGRGDGEWGSSYACLDCLEFLCWRKLSGTDGGHDLNWYYGREIIQALRITKAATFKSLHKHEYADK